jgi:uncharacterized NAD(P)/FAD-binding protein YdhS
MQQDAPRPATPKRVAIVGGGAAGTLLALQLAERGIASTLLDRSGAFARGVAYSATSPWHRLNVPIDKMGGWRADEADTAFQTWYVTRHGPLSDRYSDRYVPRSDYGAWLRHELDRGVVRGLVELRTEEVISITEDGARVRLGIAGGDTHTAAAAVLCLGNQRPRRLELAPAERYVADIWAPGAMADIGADEPVLIVGTGSTGIDALLELHHRGHRGTIHLLSRRGLLPLIDAPPRAYTFKRTPIAAARRLGEVVGLLRQEAEQAVAEGQSWQSVVDAFRAFVPKIWEGLSPAERGRFLRHLRAYWLIHRHRLAPDIAELLDKLRAAGRVVVLRGRLSAARQTGSGSGVAIDITRPDGLPLSIPAGWIVNCTGPEEDFRRVGDPLVDQLFRSGAARPGTLGVGLDVDREARLLRTDGTPNGRLFALGGATRARFGEVTSAPQIRRRASVLVGAIASALNEMERPR